MIKVYGFPRSGNNLLARYIAETFYPDLDTSTPAGPWGHWSRRLYRDEALSYGKCLGSHNQFPRNGVYAIRNPVDVAYSVWRSPGFTHRDLDVSFSEFIRMPLDWSLTPSMRYYGKKTVVEHHADHVHRSHHGVWVNYSMLLFEPELMMSYLSEKFELEIKQFSVIKEPTGYSPNLGKPKIISQEDRNHINTVYADYMLSEYNKLFHPENE